MYVYIYIYIYTHIHILWNRAGQRGTHRGGQFSRAVTAERCSDLVVVFGGPPQQCSSHVATSALAIAESHDRRSGSCWQFGLDFNLSRQIACS